jgi:hypothetical protein
VAGGDPMYITRRVQIASPERIWCCSSSDNQGNGMILLFDSKRLGSERLKLGLL